MGNRTERLRLSTLMLVSFFLFASCSQQIVEPSPTVEPGESSSLTLGPYSDTFRTLLSEYNVDEDVIHEHLLQYTVGYNRVASLLASVLYADYTQVDRTLLKRRIDAALLELDAYLEVCKELEAIGISVNNAIEAYGEDRSLFTERDTGDATYARRLIEMMLDPEYQATFNLQDIARRTGVETKKLHYLMQQTAKQMDTQVDIVDEQEYEKEIEYLETVRDTAGKVNATLALATPFGAFGTATSSVANAVGWAGKAKQAYSYVENASAMITFSQGVVELTVDQGDIPPAFKTITDVNQYVGIALGGVTGFTGDKVGDKLVGIIGSAADVTAKVFTIKDGKVDIAPAPEIPQKSAEEVLSAVLPEGPYRIPTDEMQWPDFDWGSAEELSDWYDELVRDDWLSDAFETVMETWDASVNDAAYTSFEVASSASNGMPTFFDDEEYEEAFPDHEDIAKENDSEGYSIRLYATPPAIPIPANVSFTAVVSDTFTPGTVTYHWDFGDGYTETGSSGSIVHTYAAAPPSSSYTVSVSAVDGQGNQASKEISVVVGQTLQEVIDSYDPYSTISVGAGTYTESIVLHEGCRLIGSGEGASIIAGKVTLHPDTYLEGFTVQGTDLAGGIVFDATSDELERHDHMDISLKDVTVEGIGSALNLSYAISAGDFKQGSPDTMYYVGSISSCTIRNNESGGIGIFDQVAGTIEYNLLSGNTGIQLALSTVTDSATIQNNEILDGTSDGVQIYELHGNFNGNHIEGNRRGFAITSLYPASEIRDNTIKLNSPGGGGWISDMHGGNMSGNLFEGNEHSIYYPPKGGGLFIDRILPGSDSTITQNQFLYNTVSGGDGGGLYIRYLGYDPSPSGYDPASGVLFSENTLQENATVTAMVDGYLKTGGEGGGAFFEFVHNASVRGNTFHKNSAITGGGGLYVNSLLGSLSNNNVRENLAKKNGGGVYISTIQRNDGGVGSFSGNTIGENSIIGDGDGYGGGLYISSIYGECSENIITGNTIDSPQGDASDGGGASFSLKEGGVFTSNTVSNNRSERYGGGVHSSRIDDGSSFQSNQVTGNSAGMNGGGGYFKGSGPSDYEFSQTNSFSGNTLITPVGGAKSDLYTDWLGDDVPSDEP
ncbi:MAG: right-handed parallel beta-helix repeat-containing protein [Sphaerochaeta sp.]